MTHWGWVCEQCGKTVFMDLETVPPLPAGWRLQGEVSMCEEHAHLLPVEAWPMDEPIYA